MGSLLTSSVRARSFRGRWARPGDVEERARSLRVAVWDERDLLAALTRGDGISALLEARREVLQERPSSAGWEHLVRVLDRWEEHG